MRVARTLILAVLLLVGAVPVSAGTDTLTFQTSPCVADGVEHLIGGYTFFGTTTYLIRALSVTGAATIQIRSATGYLFDANGNLVPADVPLGTIFAEATSTGPTKIQGYNNEWQAGVSAGVYCTATGGGSRNITVKIYYEAYE